MTCWLRWKTHASAGAPASALTGAGSFMLEMKPAMSLERPGATGTP